MNTSYKIQALSIAQETVKQWKNKGLKVVFTNGCFDILHMGHVDYLEKARNLGDRMIVGLNSDASVSKIKGDHRPICPQESRARVLAALAFVDLVVLFEEPTPLELITALAPNVLVKGSDYLAENIVGANFVRQQGGIVETIDLVEGFSTSSIIDKIKKSLLR